ncbi:hypothetical protein LZ30DRAFT_698109 [Colletotrichum cereale]|nr:hypothetical protein LZ30DRAFT_698109 [Colletotrichum cereale]
MYRCCLLAPHTPIPCVKIIRYLGGDSWFLCQTNNTIISWALPLLAEVATYNNTLRLSCLFAPDSSGSPIRYIIPVMLPVNRKRKKTHKRRVMQSAIQLCLETLFFYVLRRNPMHVSPRPSKHQIKKTRKPLTRYPHLSHLSGMVFQWVS